MNKEFWILVVVIFGSIGFTLAMLRTVDYLREQFSKPDPPYKFLDELLGKKIAFHDNNFGNLQGTIQSVSLVKGKGRGGSKNYDLVVKVGRNDVLVNIYSNWRAI